MPDSVTMRTAAAQDRTAIVALVRDAFSGPDRDGQEEVDIVTATWLTGQVADGLEILAADGNNMVGYVLAAQGDLSGKRVLAVAPLAVAPYRQRQGIGSALMHEVIQRADDQQWPLVLLLGSPDYYARFGFEPASDSGIVYARFGEPDPAFQVRKLTNYDASCRGTFTYCWEYGLRS